MKLMFLPANQAWVFLFGADINTAQLISMDGQYFFRTRQDAVDAANRMKLFVLKDGTVSCE